MNIVTTIVPIFTIIIIGWLARQRGFIPDEFFAPANRLVFYLAIPAMVFQAIAKSSLKTDFDGLVLAVTLGVAAAIYAVTWTIGITFRLPRRQRGTFIQNAFHGNLGYIGLAVAYYYLGTDGLAKASILAGFMMIFQNLLSVFCLQVYSDSIHGSGNKGHFAIKIMANPIIGSALAGIFFSLAAIPLPPVLDRCLAILGGLALPMALLIIGGSLSFEMRHLSLPAVIFAVAMKLVVLPGLGYTLYRFFEISQQAYMPGIILLASPTATVAYVMAKEMSGDTELAVVGISVSTLLSAVTFFMWLNIVG
jgi:predicted permease